MTNEDAIKQLQFRVDYAKSFEHSDADFVPVEALDLAIKALEFIEENYPNTFNDYLNGIDMWG